MEMMKNDILMSGGVFEADDVVRAAFARPVKQSTKGKVRRNK